MYDQIRCNPRNVKTFLRIFFWLNSKLSLVVNLFYSLINYFSILFYFLSFLDAVKLVAVFRKYFQ